MIWAARICFHTTRARSGTHERRSRTEMRGGFVSAIAPEWPIDRNTSAGEIPPSAQPRSVLREVEVQAPTKGFEQFKGVNELESSVLFPSLHHRKEGWPSD